MTIRTWCSQCSRSIDSSPEANTYAPCPYCGEAEAKVGCDPLVQKVNYHQGADNSFTPTYLNNGALRQEAAGGLERDLQNAMTRLLGSIFG